MTEFKFGPMTTNADSDGDVVVNATSIIRGEKVWIEVAVIWSDDVNARFGKGAAEYLGLMFCESSAMAELLRDIEKCDEYEAGVVYDHLFDRARSILSRIQGEK